MSSALNVAVALGITVGVRVGAGVQLAVGVQVGGSVCAPSNGGIWVGVGIGFWRLLQPANISVPSSIARADQRRTIETSVGALPDYCVTRSPIRRSRPASSSKIFFQCRI